MRVGPVVFLALLPLAARAQSDVSLGAGLGTVRYPGGFTFSATTISPGVQIVSPSFYLTGTGSLSFLNGGARAVQARVETWTPVSPRVALSAGAAASTISGGDASAEGWTIAEWLPPLSAGPIGAALGVGGAAGAIEHTAGVGALRLRARGWWQVGSETSPTQLTLSVEPTRFLGAWYTDVVAGATVDRGRVIASAWATTRLSAVYGSKGTASAALQYYVSPQLAVELGGGGYLANPFQDLPRAGYITAGIRLHGARRALALVRSAAPGPLVGARRGDSVVVRFRMPGATRVAIAGDWNAWQPAPLTGLGGDFWEGAFVLPPGTYHFSLVVDGNAWVVPGGVAAVPDGMGGKVAILTVL